MDYKEKKIYDPVPAYRKNAFSVKIIGEIVHVKGFGRGTNKRWLSMRGHIIVLMCCVTTHRGQQRLSLIPTESTGLSCITTDGWCVCVRCMCLCVG